MKYMTFADLRGRRIVPNRTTLSRWQRKIDFPLGFLIGPNRRVWSEDEIDTWIAERERASAETDAT